MQEESKMVQIMRGGACQAAGKMPGGDFRHAPCILFLGTNSGDRVREGHMSLESQEPLWRMWLQVEEKDLLSSWRKEEGENRASPGGNCI